MDRGAVGVDRATLAPDRGEAVDGRGHVTVVLDLPIDIRVLAFTTAVSVCTAILFGLGPALRASRVDLAPEFQGGARSVVGRRSRATGARATISIITIRTPSTDTRASVPARLIQRPNSPKRTDGNHAKLRRDHSPNEM